MCTGCDCHPTTARAPASDLGAVQTIKGQLPCLISMVLFTILFLILSHRMCIVLDFNIITCCFIDLQLRLPGQAAVSVDLSVVDYPSSGSTHSVCYAVRGHQVQRHPCKWWLLPSPQLPSSNCGYSSLYNYNQALVQAYWLTALQKNTVSKYPFYVCLKSQSKSTSTICNLF